jgi:hypothetical protein
MDASIQRDEVSSFSDDDDDMVEGAARRMGVLGVPPTGLAKEQRGGGRSTRLVAAVTRLVTIQRRINQSINQSLNRSCCLSITNSKLATPTAVAVTT